MEKEQCALNLYNGITRYRINYINYLRHDLYDDIDMEDIKYALMSLVFLDVLFNKEAMIKTENGINYSSKMSDNFLDDMFKIMNSTDSNQNIDKLKDGPTFLAIIRNKLAHGDYYIDKDDLVFLKENDEVRINIYKFISFYIPLINILDARIDDESYTKIYLENRGVLAIKEPIKNERDLKLFLSLLKLKSYNLRRIDGKPLKTREKLRLKNDVYRIELESSNKNNAKELERIIQEEYKKNNYILTITNKKIKDKELIDEIRKIIQVNNELYNPDTCDISNLVYIYGNDIYKMIDKDYEDVGLRYGIKLNMTLLNQLKQNNSTDINKCNSNILNILKPLTVEFNSAIILARIYSLYCHPFDNVYKSENRYHFFRDNELDFSKLNLSDIVPDIIKVPDDGIKEVEKKIDLILKQISSITDRLNKLKNNIDGMKNKELTDKQKAKLDIFIIEQENKTERLNELYDIYFEYQRYYECVKKDYTDNYDYFYNRAIIEGIRNAISHGNVTIDNSYGTKYISDTVLKFTNVYEGEVCFQASVSLYNLEGLFEKNNIDVLCQFFDKKMKEKIKKQ